MASNTRIKKKTLLYNDDKSTISINDMLIKEPSELELTRKRSKRC